MNILKEMLTLYFIFPTVFLVGGYLSYQLKFLQVSRLFFAFHLIKTQKKRGGISSFSAVAAILGGNLGTGNISGVAVALSTGGPGSLFWMWIMAFLASILKFAGCFLGVSYRQRDEVGEWVGGPMYYLSKGLKLPFLAKLFCISTIASALTVGNMVQVHSLVLPLHASGSPPFIFEIGLAILVGAVIWGGLQRFATVVSFVVPFMAFFYILSCLAILVVFYHKIPFVFQMVFRSALGMESMAGGVLGYGVLKAITSGFDRGLFATDSGLGLAPIIHSAVTDTHEFLDNKVIQGLISILSPMLIMVVCTMTGAVLLVTGVWETPGLESTTMCSEAFKIGFNHLWAGHVVTITLFFFAFTTLLTWSFCADKAVEYLYGRHRIKLFQCLFIFLIPFGGLMEGKQLWIIADIALNIMFMMNVTGIVGLSWQVIDFTKKNLRNFSRLSISQENKKALGNSE